MGQSETFEHTADLGLRVVGLDLKDLFETAASGLFDVIVANRDGVQPREEESVILDADSTTDLMLAWLNELIYRCETHHRFYSRFTVEMYEEGRSLHATIAGEPIDLDRHVLDHEVKAATRHGLMVEPGEDGWLAEIILDI
jgi:SHS2 domain-containing protein